MTAQTLEEIVENVLDMIDRPDLLQLARKRMRNVLKSCHASADFHRDLVQTSMVAASVDETTLVLPTNYRKLFKCAGYDSGLELMRVEYEQQGIIPNLSYFGFVQPKNSYSLRGGSIFFRHTSPVPAYVAAWYFKYPTFEVSTGVETLGQITTDSWVLQNYSEALEQGLLFELAKAVEHKTYLSSAGGAYQQALLTMLENELVEIP